MCARASSGDCTATASYVIVADDLLLWPCTYWSLIFLLCFGTDLEHVLVGDGGVAATDEWWL